MTTSAGPTAPGRDRPAARRRWSVFARPGTRAPRSGSRAWRPGRPAWRPIRRSSPVSTTPACWRRPPPLLRADDAPRFRAPAHPRPNPTVTGHPAAGAGGPMNTAAREAVATSVPFTPPVSSRARADRWWAARLTQKGGRRGSFTLRPAPLPSRSGAMTPFPVSAGAAVHPKDMRRPPFSSPPTPRAAAAGSLTAPVPGPVHSLGRRDVHFALERALLTAHLDEHRTDPLPRSSPDPRRLPTTTPARARLPAGRS